MGLWRFDVLRNACSVQRSGHHKVTMISALRPRLPQNVRTLSRRIQLTNVRQMVVVTKTEAGSAIDVAASPPDSSFVDVLVGDDGGGVTVTSSCFQRVKNLVEHKEGRSLDDAYLRLYVDAGGCSGFQYKFELMEDSEEAVDLEEDAVFEQQGARVVIDQGSLQFVKGSKVDFVQEMIKSSFAVTDNPQSESACGCGSSFAMKNFASNPALD